MTSNDQLYYKDATLAVLYLWGLRIQKDQNRNDSKKDKLKSGSTKNQKDKKSQ